MTSVSSRGPTALVRGRDEGPVRSICEVLACRRVGSYHQLTIVAPEVAARAWPGQFVSLGVGGEDTVLRRPFSLAGVNQQEPAAGTVDIVFDIVGPGTAWLAQQDQQAIVDVVGPLGRGFPMPAQAGGPVDTHPAGCLLVGGGYGAAPLLYLAGHLQQRGHRVDLLFGAKSSDRVFHTVEAQPLASAARFTTEDGSFGSQGRVTDVLDEVLETTRAGVIYACGPMGMLAGVAAAARQRGVPCQVAVEEDMACGVGVCMTCVIPYRRESGLANVRACVEGPVLDGERVVWEAIGTPLMAGLDPDATPGAEEPR